MTDPRMTPTNDAPVTVEQCDREAAARERTAEYEGYGFNAERLETPTEMRRGHRDWDPLVQKHARHRLAALASAPAGDGAAIEALNSIIRGLRSVLQDIANDEGDTVLGRRCIAAISKSRVPALARPRAAVGEESREAIARIIWQDRHPTGTSWDDWERQVAANGGFDGRDGCRKLADAILALQSPPAKVEG